MRSLSLDRGKGVIYKGKLIRETGVIVGIIVLALICNKVDYLDLKLPVSKIDTRIVPKYKYASVDASMVIFENNLIYLFKREPKPEEVVGAYQGKGSELVAKILYPYDTFKDFWVFHLNLTYGFLGIELKRIVPWLMLLAYPLYWVVRCVNVLLRIVRG